jgi:hypothetical protein
MVTGDALDMDVFSERLVNPLNFTARELGCQDARWIELAQDRV